MMEIYYNILQTNYFLIGIAVINILLLILYVSNLFKLRKINKNYKTFMKKIGNGNDIDEMLNKYIQKVEEVVSVEKKPKERETHELDTK